MRSFSIYLACITLLCLAKSGHAVEYNGIRQEGSSLSFVFKQMGVPVEGGFQRFYAQLSFDSQRPELGSVSINIDTSSIDVGSAEGNEEVKGKNWFNVEKFPAARFVSSGIKALGGNLFEASGKMTIKDRTMDVKVPFTLKQKGAAALMEGSFTIKRLEWGIGQGVWSDIETVSDEVEIRFKLVASVTPQGKKGP